LSVSNMPIRPYFNPDPGCIQFRRKSFDSPGSLKIAAGVTPPMISPVTV
jgi:hypothetical protein